MYVGPHPATADDPSAVAHVLGPTTPSALRPCCDCQVFVAAAVAGPNFPSGATPMTFCQSTTSGPLAPCWIVACVVMGAVAAAGIVGPVVGVAVATAAMATPCSAAHDLCPTTPSAVQT